MTVDLLYDLLYLFPFVLTVTSIARRFINDDIRLFPMVWIALATALFLAAFKNLKLRGKAVLSGVLTAFVLSVLAFIRSGERMDFIKDHMWMIWVVIIAAACFLISLSFKKFSVIRIILAMAALIYLITSFIIRQYVNKLCVCMIMMFTIFTIVDLLQRRSVKEGDTDIKKHVVGVSPFILLIFIIIGFISIPSKAYDWGFVKKVTGFLKSNYIRITEDLFGENEWDSDSPMIGFSNRSEPGGDLSKLERTVMEIKTHGNNDPGIYLSGKSFDTFNGRSWDKKDNSKINEKLLDTIETVNAVNGVSGEIPKVDIIKNASVAVEYKDMHTVCVFTPPKYVLFKSETDDVKWDGGDVLFGEKKQSELPYNVNYLRLNRDSAAFEKFIDSKPVMTKEGFDEAKEELRRMNDVSYEDYEAYRDLIYKYYLPETKVSSDVKKLTDEIIKDADTDYEKLCALEKMFSAFKYTEKPGHMPLSVNSEEKFLDYFILDKKEGYCSYYATSFVLLARSYGFPARYVQGYKVPMGKNSVRNVSSNYAHAWAEVYIDGIGWLVFEPTPGMRSDISWQLKSEKEAAAFSDQGSKSEEAEDTAEDEPDDTDEPSEEDSFRLQWYQIFIPILAGLMLSLLFLAVDRLIKAYKYAHMSDIEKAEYDCKRRMDALKRKHFGRQDEETLEEYYDRIKDFVPKDELNFIREYEEILYGMWKNK